MQNRVIQRMSLVSKSLVLNRLTSVNIYHSASTSDANALQSERVDALVRKGGVVDNFS